MKKLKNIKFWVVLIVSNFFLLNCRSKSCITILFENSSKKQSVYYEIKLNNKVVDTVKIQSISNQPYQITESRNYCSVDENSRFIIREIKSNIVLSFKSDAKNNRILFLASDIKNNQGITLDTIYVH